LLIVAAFPESGSLSTQGCVIGKHFSMMTKQRQGLASFIGAMPKVMTMALGDAGY
jgi:hypothetical protein